MEGSLCSFLRASDTRLSLVRQVACFEGLAGYVDVYIFITDLMFFLHVNDERALSFRILLAASFVGVIPVFEFNRDDCSDLLIKCSNLL